MSNNSYRTTKKFSDESYDGLVSIIRKKNDENKKTGVNNPNITKHKDRPKKVKFSVEQSSSKGKQILRNSTHTIITENKENARFDDNDGTKGFLRLVLLFSFIGQFYKSVLHQFSFGFKTETELNRLLLFLV
ncbi:hypothetical protein RhiirC2_710093 [Rhizophagus irregularis]|uniref:Uncharacterized protein n=1 Tax=Rhizophagus irregularis TaxID=588596 RepID=A0A2N1NFX4_9GLOM|nr:hypothetical protein RhiirC2_710093 [Rhizophagus irregularis]